jgi:hypothetical protein
MSFRCAFSSELLKYRRSTVLAVAIGIPVFAACAWFLGLSLTHGVSINAGLWSWDWMSTAVGKQWSLLFLPFIIPILVALACELDRASNGWKTIIAQPVSRTSIYIAKLMVLEALVLLSGVVLGASTWLAGSALGLLGAPPLLRMIGFSLAAAVTAVPNLALQLWLSTRFRSFWLPIGIGYVGNILGALTFKSLIGQYLPWSLPIHLLAVAHTPNAHLTYSIVACMLAWTFVRNGMRDFAYKDVE